MIRRKRVSPIWDHFKVIPGQAGHGQKSKATAKCNNCGSLISNQQGNTSNMAAHLKNKHIAHFLNMQAEKERRARPGFDEQADDEQARLEDDGHLLSDVEVRVRSPSLSPSPTPGAASGGSGCATSASASTGAFSPPPSPSPSASKWARSATPQQQVSMDSFTNCGTKTTERLHYAVSYYIVTCNRPLNTVEKKRFKEMLRAFKPGYKLLSRRSLTDKYIPQLVEQVKSHLKSLLKDAGDYALISDNWTSAGDVPFTCMTAHFFDKDWGNLYAVTLSCRATHAAHTGVNLKDFFEEALESWNANIDYCVALTTDNASEMRLSAELLHVPHMRCIGRNLQNGVSDILKREPIKDAVKASKDLLAWLSTPKVWTAYASWVKSHHGGDAKVLPSISPTRWWTELKLFEQVIESFDLIRQFAAAFERGKHLRHISGQSTMYILQCVVRAFKPVEEICTNLSADTYVTASTVLPILHLLEAGFEDDDADFPEDPLEDLALDTESPKPSVLRESILLKLRKRYSPGPLTEADLQFLTPQMAAQAKIDYSCAVKCNNLLVKVSYLDPRYKEELTADERVRAREYLKAEFTASLQAAGSNSVNEAASAGTTKKPSLSGLFAKRRKTASAGSQQAATATTTSSAPPSPEVLFEQELARYDSAPAVDMEVDIRLWWKERLDAYPRLQRMARKYLCIPATSTTSNRLFSLGGNVIIDTRTCLGDELAEILIFLSSNSKFLKKPA